MTSEAKIGLLLGLVVIFIIALVVNGLPSFHKSDSTNAMTEETVKLDNSPPVLAEGERQLSRELGPSSSLQPLPSGTAANQPATRTADFQQTTSPDSADVRSIIPAPQMATGNQPTGITTLTTQGTNVGGNVLISGQQSAGIPNQQQGNTVQAQNPTIVNAQRVREVQPASKTYIVKSGDSLAEIAVKMYGAKEGNRRVNVERIFNANKNVLKSSDEIYEGQKLVIPNLPTSEGTATAIRTTTSSSGNTAAQSSGSKEYVVAEGDSLWKIAEAKLGNGLRYTDIAKLNSDVLKDGDNLTIGMKLKLPTK